MLSPPCPSRGPVPHSSTHAVQPVEQAGQAPSHACGTRRMVATVALYSGHALIAGLVCAKARNARQLLGGCWPGAALPSQACSYC